jgi:SM-20-related protein
MPEAGAVRLPDSSQPLPLSVNAALDIPALADRYRLANRLQIREFLAPASAKEVLGELQRLPWGLRYNDGSRIVTTRAEALARLNRDEAARVMTGINERARAGYQFLYGVYPLSTAYFAPTMERLPIHRLYEFINSECMLEIVREVSGQPNLVWADGKATCYRPGHFLKAHTDAGPGRVVA